MPFNPLALIGQAAGDIWMQKEGNKARTREQDRARAHDINMWDKTNFYNDPKAQMERLRSAGLNPNMVYGGSSGQTAGQANALPGAKAPDIKNIETRQPLMDYVTVKNTEAQTENVRSMQNLNDANAYKTYDDILSNKKNRNKTDQEIQNLIKLRDGIKSDNISNDLRWMNSGPLTGLGEIELQALQPGSSIMPGKVNPVIPEAVAMACADVIGNDVTVTIAGQSGNFQLNVMLPVVAYNLLKSINLLGNAMPLLANKAIKTFKVNSKNINESLSKNPILVTALNRVIGYSKAAAIAKKAYKESKSIIDVAHEETGISKSELVKLLDPSKLTKGGISE